MKPGLIRIIGDPILQHGGLAFPKEPSKEEIKELQRQISLAKDALILTGGAGIAANQCAAISQPYQFTIVGVFHENEEHVRNVSKRYPGVQFPEALIMINPRILSQSSEQMHFYHGCLSVPGKLRGELATPAELQVEYRTLSPEGEMIQETKIAQEMAAVVLQHELNHILWGKTYLDCCLLSLRKEDLGGLLGLLEAELERREREGVEVSEGGGEGFYRIFKLGVDGYSCLDQVMLVKAMKEDLSTATLRGIRERIIAFSA